MKINTLKCFVQKQRLSFSMNYFTNKPDAHALLEQIRIAIAQNGLLFMKGQSSNTQVLADLGITSVMQRKIIDNLVVDDYWGCPKEDSPYPWKFVAGFHKRYNEFDLGIKISVGLEFAPAVCLGFGPHASMVYKL